MRKLLHRNRRHRTYALTAGGVGQLPALPSIPVVTPGTFSVSESVSTGVTVGTLSATNSPTSWAIVSGNTGGAFALSNAGILTVAAGLDYETLSSYSLSVTATSASGTSPAATITVNVTNVAESVPVVTASQSFSTPESAAPSTVVGTVLVTAGDTPTTGFAIVSGAGGKFAISASGVITVDAALDYETTASYTLSVTATNGAGTSAAVNVGITITNVADVVPTITASQSFSVSESASVSTVVGAVAYNGGDSTVTAFSIQSGNTGTAFAIDSAGQITVAAALDYDTLSSYALGIRATNSAGNSATVSVGVTVTEVSVVTPPAIANQRAQELDGGSAGASPYVLGFTPTAGNALAVIITGWASSGYDVTSVTDNYGNTYAVYKQQTSPAKAGVAIAIAKVATTGATFTVTINHLPTSGKYFGIDVIELSNVPASSIVDVSVVSTGSAATLDASLDLPAHAGPSIILTAISIETAAGDTDVTSTPPTGYTTIGEYHNYTASHHRHSAYKIVSAAGDESLQWDHENYGSGLWVGVAVAIKGSTSGGAPAVPVVTPATFSVNESVANGTTVGTMSATNSPTSWAIVSGNTGTAFAINSSGVITKVAALDHGTLSSYSLGTQATNAGGTSTTATATVNVTEAGAEAFYGPAGTSTVLSNMFVHNTVQSNNGLRVAYGFKTPGTQITGFRTYHVADNLPGAGGTTGYSIGDGGVMKYKVYADVGGAPGGAALASTPAFVGSPLRFDNSESAAASRYPGAIYAPYGESSNTQLKFRRLDLSSPLTVAAGTKLWMVLENCSNIGSGYTTPDFNHSISLDCEYNRHVWLRKLMDPIFDDHEFRVLLERPTAGSWLDMSAGTGHGTMIGIMEVLGNVPYGYASYGSPFSGDTGDASSGFRIDGTKRARERWLPSQNMLITKFGLCAARLSGSADVTVNIRQNATTIHSFTMSGFPSTVRTDGLFYWDVGSVVVNLADIPVTGGVDVYFEILTAAGAVYLIAGSKDGVENNLFTTGGFPAGDGSHYNGSIWSPGNAGIEVSCNWLAKVA